MISPEPYRQKWTDADVEAHWDQAAPIYIKENDKVKAAHDQRFVFSLRHLDLYCNAKVLNVSSRDGEASEYINCHEPSVDVTNAEISSKLMEVAAQARPSLKQLKIDSYSKLPFEDEQFDRVLSLETLEHVENPIAFLQELHRVSIPDARLVLSCPPATSEIPYRVFTFLFGGHGEGPHKFPPSRQVKEWLKLTGWELIHHEGTVLIPVGPSWLVNFGERMIGKMQGTFISELGIRQFYVCKKY